MDIALQTAIDRLVQVTHDLGMEHSFAPFDKVSLDSIRQKLSLPEQMVEWYLAAAPRDFELPSFGSRPVLYHPERLPGALLGYNLNPVTGKKIDSWPDDWLVFGGEGRYPLITRTKETSDTDIYYGEIYERNWRITSLSSSLEDFLLGLSDYLTLYYSRYQGVICDENGVLIPSFQNDFAMALDTRTSTIGRGQVWLRGWLGM